MQLTLASETDIDSDKKVALLHDTPGGNTEGDNFGAAYVYILP